MDEGSPGTNSAPSKALIAVRIVLVIATVVGIVVTVFNVLFG